MMEILKCKISLVMLKFNRTRTQEKKLNELAEKEDILLAVVYGSFAVGRETKDSDIDIAILRKGESDIRDYFHEYGRRSAPFPVSKGARLYAVYGRQAAF